MRAVNMMIWVVAGLLVVGCASSGPETPRTEVDGLVVVDGDEDFDREFSDAEVATFAAAQLEVRAIQQRYQAQIAEAEGEERQHLIAEGDQRTEAAIAEQGMTTGDYNSIAVRLPDDEELRERVGVAMQELEAQRIEETEQQLESQ